MNILTINILVALFCLIIGYIFGSIPTSVWVGKIFFHQDPRDYGSHNAGGTNAGRLWGKKVGFCVIMFDMIKTIAPLYIVWAILTFVPLNNGQPLLPTALEMYKADNISSYMIHWPVYWLTCIGSLLGNIFPLFTGFRGGKAASTYLGLTITTTWGLTLIGIFTYFITLFKSRYVSLSSIVCGICNVIVTWVWAILLTLKVIPSDFLFFINWGPMLYCNYVFAIVMTILVAVMVYRHHENIGRIKAGNERKVHWMDRKKPVNN